MALLDEPSDSVLAIGALDRCGVPAIRGSGSICERIPQPVTLDDGLWRELHETCGVGLHHIELLTGQPLVTIRRRLAAGGVRLRPPGGRNPFLRRVTGGPDPRPRP